MGQANFSTRERILGVAETLFARHGFAGASLRQVTATAKVNLAAVNYHFGSKEGLYRQVIDEAMGGLKTRLFAAFAQSGTPRERIHRGIGAYLEHLAQERDFPRLIQRALLNNDLHLRRVANEYLGANWLTLEIKPAAGKGVLGAP